MKLVLAAAFFAGAALVAVASRPVFDNPVVISQSPPPTNPCDPEPSCPEPNQGGGTPAK